MQKKYEQYMRRCIQLAGLGAGNVAPNPMVGAVLVYNDKIIGEGYHEQYGGPHAEVNCINSVKDADRSLIQQSTLYVSLEPCVHFGKTPPCTSLIIQNKIPEVVIGSNDPFKEINGKGIEQLKAAGIKVKTEVLKNECRELNKRFFTFHTMQRPYIILKWAQSSDGKLAGSGTDRILISNEITNRLVHKWRSEEASVLVGTNTALMDDPELTNRLWTGPSPVRLVLDKYLKLPTTLKLFNKQNRTIVFNEIKKEEQLNLEYWQLKKDTSTVKQITEALYQLKIQSVLVEGGTMLLQSFIDEGAWDEARIINNEELVIGNGTLAPVLKEGIKIFDSKILTDRAEIFYHQ